MSIPDLSKVVRSHRAIVEDDDGLRGFIIPRMVLCFHWSGKVPSLNGSVTFS